MIDFVEYIDVIGATLGELEMISVDFNDLDVFTSSIIAFLRLIRGSEKIIINSVGISNLKLTIPAVSLYIFIGIFFITIINPLTAFLDERYSELEYKYIDRW